MSTKLFIPQTNANYGVEIGLDCLIAGGFDIAPAAGGYNNGPRAVHAPDKKLPRETRKYKVLVTERFEYYQKNKTTFDGALALQLAEKDLSSLLPKDAS